jgi:hypothetical protein
MTIIGSTLVTGIPLGTLFDQIKSQTPFFPWLAAPLAILWAAPFFVLALLKHNLESVSAPTPVVRRVGILTGLGAPCLLVALYYVGSEQGISLVVMLLGYGIVSIRYWGLQSTWARRILFLGGLTGATLGTLFAYGILLQLALFEFFSSLTIPLAVLGATVGGLLIGWVLGKLFDRGPPVPESTDSTAGIGALIILTNAAAGAIGAPVAVLVFSTLADSASLQHEARQLLLNILPSLVFTGAWVGWVIGLVLHAVHSLLWPRRTKWQTPLATASLGLFPALLMTLAPGFLGERVFLPLMANDYFVLLNRGFSFVESVAESPDGSLVAAYVGHVLYVWEASTGSLKLSVDYRTPTATIRGDRLAFSPDGRRLAVVLDLGGVIVIDGETGRQVFTIDPAAANLASSDQISRAAFSPDGKYIVLALKNGIAAIYDAANGTLVDALPIALDTAVIRTASYSSDGRFLAIGGSHVDASGEPLGFVALLEVGTGTTRYVIDKVLGTVASLSFGPDGSRLLTMEIPGRASIRDAMQGTPLVELEHHCQPLLYATFVADDTSIITRCGQGTIYHCEANTGACAVAIRLKISEIKAVFAHSDGKRLVIAEGSRTISVWDWRTGEALVAMRIPAR